MTNVFTNEDSTDWPKQVPGWTVQSAPTPSSTYAGLTGFVFKDSVLGSVNTPSNEPGWTVQKTGMYAS